MKGLARAVDRIGRGWVVLLFGLLFASFLIVLLPRQAAQSAGYSAGVGSPDLQLIYGAEQLYEMAQSYGVAGRAAYIRSRLTFDLAFPISYGLFFATTIAFTLRRTWPQLLGLRSLAVVPVWALAADLAENLALVGVMSLYPQPSALLAALAAAATVSKWVLVGLSIVLAVFGSLAFLVRTIRQLSAG